MEQNSQSLETNAEHKNSTEESPLIQIERTFRAPAEQIWKALFTDPEMVKQWWGPEGFTAPVVKLDFHVGGRYIFAMQDPKGQVVYSTGIFEQITPNKKIAYTDQFSDKDGNPISGDDVEGMGTGWPMTCYVTMELEELGDYQTKLTLSHEGIPAKVHDDCIQGWNSTLDKLQKLVERN